MESIVDTILKSGITGGTVVGIVIGLQVAKKYILKITGYHNGSKNESTLTSEVAHLKETCNIKHTGEDERHRQINLNLKLLREENHKIRDNVREDIKGVHQRLDIIIGKKL